MDIFEAIQTRRSVGRTKGTVSEADLQKLIEAATWAPNHKMTQPWRFTVIRESALLLLGKKLAKLDDEPKHEKKFARSPIMIVVSYVISSKSMTAREDRDATSAAIQNMLLAAHGLGLGAIWRTGEYVDSKHFASLIKLPKDEEIVGLIGIGEIDAEPQVQERDVQMTIRTITEETLGGKK
jgi:nitroreductase